MNKSLSQSLLGAHLILSPSGDDSREIAAGIGHSLFRSKYSKLAIGTHSDLHYCVST